MSCSLIIGSTEFALGNEWSEVLSQREREVAVLVARGLSNKQVARQLGLREGTVKIHLHNIYRKLDVDGRSTLIADSQRVDSKPVVLAQVLISRTKNPPCSRNRLIQNT